MLAPLGVSPSFCEEGCPVDILFVLLEVRALTEEGAPALRIDGRRAADADALGGKLIEEGEPTDILDWLTYLTGTRNVNLCGSHIAAATFGVDELRPRPGGGGIVDATWSLRRRR